MRSQSPFPLDVSRANRIRRLTAETLDVLIIGGGIVGASVARDAAMRGLKTGLVEQCDFAFGTSSRSSRLLHGGLRYLAQGRLGLVHEASREKRVLAHIAPHLAEPLPLVFPSYARAGWSLWQLVLGVKLYDRLCGSRNFGPSSTLPPAETLGRLPGIDPHHLRGAVRYFDGLTGDARLVLDTLRSADRAAAHVCNYVRFEEAKPAGGAWECRLYDAIGGAGHTVCARTVVNAAGPWAASIPNSQVKLRLTKGVHLVIDRNRLPIQDAAVMTAGRRILFAIPWGDRIILGTTDTDYAGAPEAVCTEPADVREILAVVNRTFPEADLSPSDVISTWAGIRPLLAHAGGGPSDISRAHQITMPHPGWIDIAGGKLTVCRLIGEQVVDRIARHLKVALPPCQTAATPLLAPAEAEGRSAVLPPQAGFAAVEHYCRNEWAVHLDDVMLRRTSWHFYYREAAALAAQVADWMAAIFHWPAEVRQGELARYYELRT